MELFAINTGFFKLDGGAMFGVVPKSIWQKTNPADENNMCTWAMRCLLVINEGRVMLIDNGIGNKQSDKFYSHYYLHGEATLLSSLSNSGMDVSDITDMFHTHLHFDHCGGGVVRNEHGYELLFKNATYWTHSAHWNWAVNPNPRERASFLKENLMPIQEHGQLKYFDLEGEFPDVEILTVHGHTDSMMIPKISYKGRTICFMADLLPSVGHIPLPYVMGYDTRPLITLQEKEAFLNEAASKDYVLFFEHDPLYECCTVQHTEKGVRLKETFNLKDI